MTIENKKVSIITVVYNCVDCVEKTLLSVIDQTQKDYEYIVIDGGSTDGTVDIIKKYQNRINFWSSKRDRGIYHAMNIGARIANGTWLIFMNAGDTFAEKTTLEKMVKYSELFECSILFGDTILSNKNRLIGLRKFNRQEKLFIHQSVMYLKVLHDKYGSYIDCKHITAADYFFIACCMDSEKFEYFNAAVSIYDINGISNNKKTLYQKIFFDFISGKIGYLKYISYMMAYPMYAFIKRILF